MALATVRRHSHLCLWGVNTMPLCNQIFVGNGIGSALEMEPIHSQPLGAMVYINSRYMCHLMVLSCWPVVWIQVWLMGGGGAYYWSPLPGHIPDTFPEEYWHNPQIHMANTRARLTTIFRPDSWYRFTRPCSYLVTQVSWLKIPLFNL